MHDFSIPKLYLIDANVIIDASEKYFATKCLSQYLDWLSVKVNQGTVKMPKKIYDEVQKSDGSPEANQILFTWLHQKEIHKKIILNESYFLLTVKN